MGGGKCQLCMKESAAIRERTWREQSRVIRYRAELGERGVIHGRGKELGGPTINCVRLSEKISGNLKYCTVFRSKHMREKTRPWAREYRVELALFAVCGLFITS